MGSCEPTIKFGQSAWLRCSIRAPLCDTGVFLVEGCRVYPPWMKEELRAGAIDNDLVVKNPLGEK